jgi:hypothetical protein
MQVILGRRLAVFGTTYIEEMITKRGIKGTIIDILSYFFIFIYFGMFWI